MCVCVGAYWNGFRSTFFLPQFCVFLFLQWMCIVITNSNHAFDIKARPMEQFGFIGVNTGRKGEKKKKKIKFLKLRAGTIFMPYSLDICAYSTHIQFSHISLFTFIVKHTRGVQAQASIFFFFVFSVLHLRNAC